MLRKNERKPVRDEELYRAAARPARRPVDQAH